MKIIVKNDNTSIYKEKILVTEITEDVFSKNVHCGLIITLA